MRRTTSSLIVITASVVVLLFVGACGALARSPRGAVHQDFPPRPGATPIVIGLPNLNPPTATSVPSGNRAHNPSKSPTPPDAVRIALSNVYVKALLRGKAYRINKVAAWISGRGKLVAVGLYRAATVSGTWITVGKPPYKATVQRVIGLRIFVNMTTKSVVGVVPHVAPK